MTRLIELIRAKRKQLAAQKRLAAIRQATFESFECDQFRRRRAAALKGRGR